MISHSSEADRREVLSELSSDVIAWGIQWYLNSAGSLSELADVWRNHELDLKFLNKYDARRIVDLKNKRKLELC